MIEILIVALVLVAGGFPISYALTRSRDLALIVAPMATGLLGTTAALLSVASGSALLPWIVVIFITTWILGWLLRHSPSELEKEPVFPSRHLIVTVALSTFPLAGLRRAPIDWDARSSWFFRSKFFAGGGREAITAMQNSAFDFAHQDYPPFASAVSATIWQILGRQDYRTAQIATSFLTWSALLALAFALISLNRKGSRLNCVPAGLVVLAAYGMTGIGGTNGYVDLFNAASLTTALICLLISPRKDSLLFLLGALCLSVSFLTKFEGTVFGTCILVASLIRQRSRARRLVLIGTPALQLAWTLIVKFHGIEGDLLRPSVVARLIGNPGRALHRSSLAFQAIGLRGGKFILLAIVVSFLSWALLKGKRTTMQLGPSRWIWTGLTLYFALLVAAYASSQNGINWLLATTIERTVIFPMLLSLTDVMIWLIVANSVVQENQGLHTNLLCFNSANRLAEK